MSGCTYDAGCPRCGKPNLVCYSDYKPHDMVSGQCLDCGFEFHTVEGQGSLEEVNQLRKDYHLKPLKRLAKLTREWLESPYA